jgi:hypothetical protein
MKRIIFTILLYSLFIFISCSNIEKDYQKAIKEDSIETYEDFLKKHPESNYTKEIKNKILALEKSEFEAAMKKNTVIVYEQFIAKFPNSKFIINAKDKISFIEYQRALKIIEKYISDKQIREFLLCHFRAAYWGRYDLKTRIAKLSTVDEKPRILKFTNGKFEVQIDPKSISMPAEGHRSGSIKINSQKEAFEKGIPYFISNVKFEPPDLFHYTIVTNPQVTIDKEIYERTQSGGLSLLAKLDPFTKQLKRTLKIVNPDRERLLSIVTKTRGHPGCLQSNEVVLVYPKR